MANVLTVAGQVAILFALMSVGAVLRRARLLADAVQHKLHLLRNGEPDALQLLVRHLARAREDIAERRKEIVKDIAKMGEETKVAVRSIRREAMDKIKAMKKSGEITEDDQKQGEKKIQDKTDSHIKAIDSMTEKKQKQIMEI